MEGVGSGVGLSWIKGCALKLRISPSGGWLIWVAAMRNLQLRSILFFITFVIFISPMHTLNCPRETDSPVLRIFVNPKEIVKGQTKNVTLSCLVKLGFAGGPVTKAELWISKYNSTAKLRTIPHYNWYNRQPFNLTLAFETEEFGNESRLEAHCYGHKLTDSCTKESVVMVLLESTPTSRTEQGMKKADFGSYTDIIAITVAAIALVFCISLALFLCSRRRNGGPPSQAVLTPLEQDLDPVGPPETDVTTVAAYETYEENKEEVVCIKEDLSVRIPNPPTTLGAGKFGSVILGHMTCKDEDELAGYVAVKILNVYIVMEYLARGSLLTMLQQEGDALGIKFLLKAAYDISLGMEYLAGKQIIHRDLATRNVLIADDDSAKIADFGLARCVEETGEYKTSKGYMPIKWVALETLEGERYTMESDIWSYGIILWEIFSFGADPYNEILSDRNANVFDLRDFLKSGKRLNMPKACPNGVCDIMRRCWSPFANQRPPFTEIEKSMQRFLEEYESEELQNADNVAQKLFANC
eukprot:gene6066-11439_t